MAPNHRELKVWTSSTILKDICTQNGFSYEELIHKYKVKI